MINYAYVGTSSNDILIEVFFNECNGIMTTVYSLFIKLCILL